MSFKKTFILIPFILFIFIAFGFQNSSEHKVIFEKAKFTMETKGDLKGAIKLFEEIIEKYPDEREYAAKSQLYIGLCYEKLGLKQAQRAFQKVVQKYPEQTEIVEMAKEKLANLLRAQTVIEKGDEEFRIRKIWTDPLTDNCGAPSPNGLYLSFVDWITGDLAVRELATGKNRRLTDKGSWSASPEFALFSKWSPDSKRLVYNWYKKDEFFDLRIIEIDGSDPRVLLGTDEEMMYVHPLDWSPDGKHILAYFQRKDRSVEAVLISASDGSVSVFEKLKEPITRSPNGAVLFSPDGKYVVYDSPQEEESLEHDIFLRSVDGERKTRLVEHPADDFALCWNPDGRWLLFASDRSGSLDAWVLRVADGKPHGEPELIKKDMGSIWPMGMTRQGDFYYSVLTYEFDVYVFSLDPESGKILSPPKKATQRFEGSNRSPDWSPDGKYLAYISLRGHRPRTYNVLCIRSLETGKERELNPELIEFNYPRWSPDGRFISVEGSDDKEHFGIFRIDVQTGEVIPIVQAEPGIAIYSHRWSKDGKSIFYTLDDAPTKKSTRLLVHNLETGEDKRLQGAPSDAKDIDISMDGHWLAIINREEKRVLRIMPTAGGEPREIYNWEEKGNAIVSPAWTADGHYIIFSKSQPDPSDKWDLWRIPQEGGEPQKLDLAMVGFRHYSVHPDGKSIAFSSRGSKMQWAEIWVMENFLPEKNQKTSK